MMKRVKRVEMESEYRCQVWMNYLKIELLDELLLELLKQVLMKLLLKLAYSSRLERAELLHTEQFLTQMLKQQCQE
ncbi:hypothetical protein MtrunA17_Chr4g0023691 [Medicago truncatula]|uniref:Uncharacterized protein n=1 Tax=Medicago truncatula TaxID=3880 RepID=A0A396I3N8_MEDTR|nr:hypothetical protein MtrunA17_Chr4g0023691 [Medicago truncatula]